MGVGSDLVESVIGEEVISVEARSTFNGIINFFTLSVTCFLGTTVVPPEGYLLASSGTNFSTGGTTSAATFIPAIIQDLQKVIIVSATEDVNTPYKIMSPEEAMQLGNSILDINTALSTLADIVISGESSYTFVADPEVIELFKNIDEFFKPSVEMINQVGRTTKFTIASFLSTVYRGLNLYIDQTSNDKFVLRLFSPKENESEISMEDIIEGSMSTDFRALPKTQTLHLSGEGTIIDSDLANSQASSNMTQAIMENSSMKGSAHYFTQAFEYDFGRSIAVGEVANLQVDSVPSLLRIDVFKLSNQELTFLNKPIVCKPVKGAITKKNKPWEAGTEEIVENYSGVVTEITVKLLEYLQKATALKALALARPMSVTVDGVVGECFEKISFTSSIEIPTGVFSSGGFSEESTFVLPPSGKYFITGQSVIAQNGILSTSIQYSPY